MGPMGQGCKTKWTRPLCNDNDNNNNDDDDDDNNNNLREQAGSKHRPS